MTDARLEPRTLIWRDGTRTHALGLGTWQLGESRASRGNEVRALRQAFEIGWRVLDTAEMYGEGGAEEVLGEALVGALRAGLPRERFFVVSKVYPHHADAAGVQAACERSLRRLGLDFIDLYLLHWRGRVPLQHTVHGFQALQRRGLIARWGVSNFDVDDLVELFAVEGGADCAANQVWYSLGQRGVEFDLLPWMQARGMPLMAYCPIDRGNLARAAPAGLDRVARRHGANTAQVALAALLDRGGVMPIPKAVQVQHLRDNWAAQDLQLDEADRAAIDRACAPPTRPSPLAMT